jgi:hypothetical protein
VLEDIPERFHKKIKREHHELTAFRVHPDVLDGGAEIPQDIAHGGDGPLVELDLLFLGASLLPGLSLRLGDKIGLLVHGYVADALFVKIGVPVIRNGNALFGGTAQAPDDRLCLLQRVLRREGYAPDVVAFQKLEHLRGGASGGLGVRWNRVDKDTLLALSEGQHVRDGHDAANGFFKQVHRV